jgi:hypothetical protein
VLIDLLHLPTKRVVIAMITCMVVGLVVQDEGVTASTASTASTVVLLGWRATNRLKERSPGHIEGRSAAKLKREWFRSVVKRRTTVKLHR